MTLDEMYLEIAAYTDTQDDIGVSPYSGDALKVVNKFKSAINYAYKKIARELFKLDYSETITLDSSKEFSTTALSKTFFRIIKIEDATNTNEAPTSFEFRPSNKIRCSDMSAGSTVKVFYYYIPADLVNLTDTTAFPGEFVDPKILCYYAAYLYFKMDDDDRSELWLTLWNDSFLSLSDSRGEIKRVRDVRGVRW